MAQEKTRAPVHTFLGNKHIAVVNPEAPTEEAAFQGGAVGLLDRRPSGGGETADHDVEYLFGDRGELVGDHHVGPFAPDLGPVSEW